MVWYEVGSPHGLDGILMTDSPVTHERHVYPYRHWLPYAGRTVHAQAWLIIGKEKVLVAACDSQLHLKVALPEDPVHCGKCLHQMMQHGLVA